VQKRFVRLANLTIAKASSTVEKIKVFLCLLERIGRDNIDIRRSVRVLRRASGGGAMLTGFARRFIKSRELEKSRRDLLRNGSS
jgi:hypothetical protein